MRYQVMLPMGAGPCAKRIVEAKVVTTTGDSYEGTNYCLNPQTECPRQDMPTGQGYELCKSVCKQVGHAETVALDLAAERAQGATLVVDNHHYACNACKAAAAQAGVARLVVSGKDEPLSVHTQHPHTEWIGGHYPVNPLQHEQAK